jgi:Tfp pilus assembly protein PilO
MSIFLAQLWVLIRQHPWITAGFVIAALAGGANLPLWQERREIEREHDEVRRRGQAMLMALTDRARIQGDEVLLASAEAVIDRNLISEENMEVNLGYFYRLEKLTRIQLSRIDQLGSLPPEPGSPFRTVPVSLQLSGSYRNLLAFVRELESGPRLVRVRSFRIERADANGSEMSVTLMVDMLAKP